MHTIDCRYGHTINYMYNINFLANNVSLYLWKKCSFFFILDLKVHLRNFYATECSKMNIVFFCVVLKGKSIELIFTVHKTLKLSLSLADSYFYVGMIVLRYFA